MTWLGCAAPGTGTTVHVAASTEPVVAAVLGDAVSLNVGATSTLVRQVEAGAPADVVVSAHPKWTAHLAASHPGAVTVPVATNTLVIVGPASSAPPSRARLTAADCVALGDPEHVPVGLYAKDALTTLGVWEAVSPRVHATWNATATVAAVAAGACEIGIVYATDATHPGVVAVPFLSAAQQPDIRVDAIVLTPAGRPVADRLAHARDVWSAHGFGAP